MRLRGHVLAIAGAPALFAFGADAAPMSLASHRAVYDLSLTDTAEGADVADVSGRLVMEFTGSKCAGYTSKLRFVTETEDPDGDQQVTDSRSTTFEAGDGKSLKFTNETYTDEALAEQSSGTASRDGSEVEVDLTKPATKKIAVPSGVVFPAEQMERLIESATKGESFVHLDVYDGSEDGETVFETAGVIGKESTSSDDIGDEKAVAKAGIAGMRHWPLTISYFDKKAAGDTAPFYVLSFVVYENGVGRTLKINYGDFTLAGTLTGLELLPSTPCP